jgi:hypothetical protein
MKTNLNVEFKSIENESMMNERGRPLTLRHAAYSALSLFPDRDATVDERERRLKLAEKIAVMDGEIDLSIDELSLIKRPISFFYPAPIISSQAARMIEGAGKEK